MKGATAMATERDIIIGMQRELEAARVTLREQLMGLENQLYALSRLLDRLEAAEAQDRLEMATAGAGEAETEPEPQPDPLSLMGLAPEPDMESDPLVRPGIL
jgi:hypothetical protein